MTQRINCRNLSIIVSLFIVILLASCAQPAADFSGNWIAKTGSLDGDSYFGIVLVQDGDKLHGQHDGGLNDGSRIDASIGEKIDSITGVVKGSQALLTIKSFYAEDVTYQASFVLNKDGSGTWKISKLVDGQTYIPSEAILTRHESGNTTVSNKNDSVIAAGNAYVEEIDEKTMAIAPIQTKMSQEPNGIVSAYRIDGELLKLSVERPSTDGRLIHDFYFDAGKAKVARETVYHTGAVISETDEKDATFELDIWYFDENQNPILAIDRNQNELSKDKWNSTVGMIRDGYKEYTKIQ